MYTYKNIQRILSNLGYYEGEIDGLWGEGSKVALVNFQDYNNIPETGELDEITLDYIDKYSKGYDVYTVKQGDSLSSISRMYDINPNFILSSNPTIDFNSLVPGKRVIVPYSMQIVNTKGKYDYNEMENDLFLMKKIFPFIEIGSMGRSSLGRQLYYAKIGNGKNEVFINSSHHSLEWITTVLAMKWMENFLSAVVLNKTISGYNPREIMKNSTIYIAPMINPDGIELVQNGVSTLNPNYQKLLMWNNGSADFSKTWQANNNGVDLNHNYPAGWIKSKERAEKTGYKNPGPTRYPGVRPLSEPESKAVVDFVNEHDFRLVIAYHSQGEVIYWTFADIKPKDAERIGEEFAKVSGYTLDTPVVAASYAGMKDWFIEQYNKPGYTVEVGKGKNPLPIEQFDEIYKDNEPLITLATII